MEREQVCILESDQRRYVYISVYRDRKMHLWRSSDVKFVCDAVKSDEVLVKYFQIWEKFTFYFVNIVKNLRIGGHENVVASKNTIWLSECRVGCHKLVRQIVGGAARPARTDSHSVRHRLLSHRCGVIFKMITHRYKFLFQNDLRHLFNLKYIPCSTSFSLYKEAKVDYVLFRLRFPRYEQTAHHIKSRRLQNKQHSVGLGYARACARRDVQSATCHRLF